MCVSISSSIVLFCPLLRYSSDYSCRCRCLPGYHGRVADSLSAAAPTARLQQAASPSSSLFVLLGCQLACCHYHLLTLILLRLLISCCLFHACCALRLAFLRANHQRQTRMDKASSTTHSGLFSSLIYAGSLPRHGVVLVANEYAGLTVEKHPQDRGLYGVAS